jgi:hypothetical protein
MTHLMYDKNNDWAPQPLHESTSIAPIFSHLEDYPREHASLLTSFSTLDQFDTFVAPIARIRVANQQWLGTVVRIDDDAVHCVTMDLSIFKNGSSGSQHEYEEVEIYLESFSEHEQELLSRGTEFLWTIGQEYNTELKPRSFSEVRIIRWTL